MTALLNILAVTNYADPWVTWVSSGMIFTVVFLVILAVFGERGEVHLSPQRQAAIFAGHADRKTLFENSIVAPILWLCLTIATSLNMPRAKESLRKTLVSAGSPNFFTPEEYIALSLFHGFTAGVLLNLFAAVMTGSFSMLIFLIGVVIGTGISVYSIGEQATVRLRSITRQMPYSLDLISLAMGSGATFTEAIGAVVRDASMDTDQAAALNTEFRALMSEMDLGHTRREALENLARRVPLSSVQAIVASIMQAEELGTPLADVLHDQATTLRLERSVRAENLAASASMKILIPCLLLAVAVILTVFGPSIISIARNGLFG
ncbi:MAG: hypothetical protein HN909_03195 [Phycisphaerales bacterium]|jgi:tight adherence protein C|nr:hypothetical protein [Phycisphaerales bacterium]MBT7170757.1 hypothetical protein [Phycisphaerales bacterium]